MHLPVPYSDTAFTLFGMDVKWYAIMIVTGIILAVILGCKRAPKYGFDTDTILDLMLVVLPCAVIGARAYYVVFSWEQYAVNPIKALYIWEGGLAIYGGVLGAIVGVLVFCKIKKLKVSTVLDLMLMGFLIGQSIGRWGNFFNREAFGAETDSFLRMGLMNKYTEAVTYHHPTFLYESLWNALGFLLIHRLSKSRKFDGQVALYYAIWYGMGRCIIEGLRTDSLWWGPFRVSQLLAAISCLAGLCVLIWQLFRPHDPADLLVNRAAVQTEEPKAEEDT